MEVSTSGGAVTEVVGGVVDGCAVVAEGLSLAPVVAAGALVAVAVWATVGLGEALDPLPSLTRTTVTRPG